mmetsp:Transcript_4630/g.17413  ORF Transcript_4630/g.17413 Transcript_4630/m.17413 type:complete len:516 (-) Transcript_4630:72-1619(-)
MFAASRPNHRNEVGVYSCPRHSGLKSPVARDDNGDSDGNARATFREGVPDPMLREIEPKVGHEAWRERHEQAAAAFHELLLSIRRRGAAAFQAGMSDLWWAADAADPLDSEVDLATAAADPSNVDEVWPPRSFAQRSPYFGVTDQGLADFAEMVGDLRRDARRTMEESGSQAGALKTLVVQLGASLSQCTDVDSFRNEPFDLPPGSSDLSVDLGLQIWTMGSWAVLPLIFLPLGLYVHTTLHLYELLARLQVCAPGSQDSKPGHACGTPPIDGAAHLRGALDRDDRHYSLLAFAVTAALQTLHFARDVHLASFPVELLASSPPGPEGQPNGYPMMSREALPKLQVLYRGMWIGGEVDEERACYQYSFQSFSREASGMAKVLAFYAGVASSPPTILAAEHRHALVLVARTALLAKGSLGMPVQLFDGPREHGSELEVLFPAFVRYEFEEDLRLSSQDFCSGSQRGESILGQLQERWDGVQLPDLLLCLLRGGLVPAELRTLQALRPRITVLFVRSI